MTSADNSQRDDTLDGYIASCDEALAAGRPLPIPPAELDSSSGDSDLTRALFALELLHAERTHASERIDQEDAPTVPDSDAGPQSDGRTFPQQFGRFRIVGELGRGGCGVVFMAEDPRLGRTVALKLPHSGMLLSSSERRRFLDEARATARLDHPNVVPVFEAGEHGSVCYIVSAFCPGPSLAAWLAAQTEPVPARTAAILVAELADGVEHVHRHSIWHRDIKPANILLAPHEVGHAGALPFRPRLTDFGLAKLIDGTRKSTQTGAVLGTIPYMAPEQVDARKADGGPTIDVYALGVVLYECLTGRTPFEGGSSIEILRKVSADDPEPPRRRRADVPNDLETICLRCLEKNPKKRYLSARAFADDLRRYLDGMPVVARPLSVPGRASRWVVRRRRGVALVVFAIIALTSSLAVAMILSQSPPSSSVDPLPADELRSRQREYVLGIQRASNFLKEKETQAARGSLDSVRPAPGQSDLRGFEWDYLSRQAETLYSLSALDNPYPAIQNHYPDVTYTEGGEQMVAVGAKGPVYVWDAKTRQPLAPLPLTDGPRYLEAISPDARKLASVLQSPEYQTTVVWDLAKGIRLSERRWPANSLYRIAVSPKADTVAVVWSDAPLGTETYIALWNPQSDEVTKAPASLGHGTTGFIRFSPDGRSLAVPCQRCNVPTPDIVWIEVLDTVTGASTAHLTGLKGRILAVGWSPSGKTLASFDTSGEIKLWDIATKRVTAQGTLKGVRDEVPCLAFSRDGKSLALGSWTLPNRVDDPRVWLYDVATLNCNLSLCTGCGVYSFAFSPDDSTLLIGCRDGLVRTWRLVAEPFQVLPGHSQTEAWSVAFSPDSKTLVSGGDDHFVRLWDAATGKPGRVLEGHGSLVSGVAYSPDGMRIASVSYATDEPGKARDFSHTVKLWDAATGKLLNTLVGQKQDVRCVSFSPDGKLLATGAREGELLLWDRETGQCLAVLPGHTQFVHSVAFSPDGKSLASASQDKTVRLWDLATLKSAEPWNLGTEVRSLAFSPDGKRLAMGLENGVVRLRNMQTGQDEIELRNHAKGVWAIAFSPDGKTIATGGMDSTVRLSQAATGEELLSLVGLPDKVNSLAFSPDGTRLAAALHDGTIRLWRAPK